MRIVWKYWKIYTMKLRDDLYTLGQLLKSPILLVYNIKDGESDLAKKTQDFYGL